MKTKKSKFTLSKSTEDKNKELQKQIRQCVTPCEKQNHCFRTKIEGQMFAPEYPKNTECPYYWKQ